MAFEILFQQVNAIAHVAQGFGGQVASSFSRMAMGNMASSVLGAHLMLGDALRLAAILEDTSYLDDLDFTLKEEVSPDNSGAYILMIRDLQAQREEVELLEELVAEMEQALDLLKEQIGAIEFATRSIQHMAQASDQAEGLFGEALATLENQVLPELYALQDRLEEMLTHYQDALKNSEGNLWYLETVFKFVLPYCRALKLRRQQKLKDEQEQKDGEEGGTVQVEKSPEGELDHEAQEHELMEEAVKQALEARQAPAQRAERLKALAKEAKKQGLGEPSAEQATATKKKDDEG